MLLISMGLFGKVVVSGLMVLLQQALLAGAQQRASQEMVS